MKHSHPATDGRQIQHGDVTWVDVQRPDRDILKQLETEFHLHPVHLQESVQKVQHNQVEREDGYLFLIMHFPVYHPQSDKIQFGQIGIFLGKNFLVTIRSGRSESIGVLADEMAGDDGAQLFKHGASYLLFVLISRLLSELSSLTDHVVSELDNLEDVVFDNNVSDAMRIGRVRQKIVRLMRIIGPKRILLQDLAEQIGPFAGHESSKFYSSNLKSANKLYEIIEESKETVEIYKDADFTTSTERTNSILAVLTIIFTLTIPVTVVGTLYGMNVDLPGGVEAGAWTFFGRYTTLCILIVVSSLMAGAMYAYFKFKKWF